MDRSSSAARASEPLRIARFSSSAPDFAQRFAPLLERRLADKSEVERSVAEIAQAVRQRGDAALIEITARIDGYRLEPAELVLGRAQLEARAATLTAEDRGALALAAERIRSFHAAHVPQSWEREEQGGRLGQLVRPLERVGLYVPASQAPLASTVLMLAIPAQVAGVKQCILACPGREPHPAIAGAALLAGVERLLCVGGAQAVAALAYGTQSVPRVDKIVGPGSVWTQAAKRLVFGEVGIDAEAGPSEVMIVADASADPEWVAADLLAQAEHDERSSVVLATPSAELVEAVARALARQIADLPRAAVARACLCAERSALIVTRDVAEAVELANQYAAEHLQLWIAEPERWLPAVRNAGAVFAGPWSPVPAGDYAAGPSHVLPTGGTARFFSVVGVEDFQKRMSLIQLSQAGLASMAGAAVRLAELEGLEGHARALRVRSTARPGRRGPGAPN
jgi:histidinol dehydrogenase